MSLNHSQQVGLKIVSNSFTRHYIQHLNIVEGYVAIPEKHDKLITSLRTAWALELSLDKEQTSYNDLFDALRLSLKGYNIE